MTHDERIEAMARAHWSNEPNSRMLATFDELSDEAHERLFKNMEAALAAAGVEEMVREAARKTAAPLELRDEWVDDLVREVMGK